MLDLPKMPVSRNSGSNHCKKGEIIKSLDLFLQEIDEGAWTVISSATDYPENWVIPEHSHEKHQLLYAIEGVMVVHSAHNQWTVPPNRGFWMPCGHRHSLRCVGPLKMRSVFVRPDSFPNLPVSFDFTTSLVPSIPQSSPLDDLSLTAGWFHANSSALDVPLSIDGSTKTVTVQPGLTVSAS